MFYTFQTLINRYFCFARIQEYQLENEGIEVDDDKAAKKQKHVPTGKSNV